MSRPPTGSPDRVEQLEADVASLRAEIARMTEARAPRPWRRRLSGRLAAVALALTLIIPAGAVLASHQFNDVPTNHQFHNAIAAIADAGITTGCGGGNYCPDGLVTRGQMAAFLSRLGALQAGSAPKVNADRIDGRHASDLTRVASFSTGATTAISTTATQYGPDLLITAPTAGFVTINYGFTLQGLTCATTCSAWANVRHVETGTFSQTAQVYVDTTTPYASGSTHRVFSVAAGTNTFELLLTRASTSGTINGWFASGTAQFTPFGSTGGSTLGLSMNPPDTIDKDPGN